MIIVADIGGSRMRIAASEADGTLGEPVGLDTPQTFEAGIKACADAAREVANGASIKRVVLGIAGVVARDHATLLHATHLPDWNGKDIAQALGKTLGVPVTIENDTALGALGEAHAGAGTGADILAYVAVGTGIGGARVINGSLDSITLGFEPGHQRLGVHTDAPEWEELVSGSGLEKIHGAPAKELTDPAIWEAAADVFAIGLYNTILNWSPDRVVLGGSLFLGAHSIPIDRVRTTLKSLNTILPSLPDLHLAALEFPTLYGALALAKIQT